MPEKKLFARSMRRGTAELNSLFQVTIHSTSFFNRDGKINFVWLMLLLLLFHIELLKQNRVRFKQTTERIFHFWKLLSYSHLDSAVFLSAMSSSSVLIAFAERENNYETQTVLLPRLLPLLCSQKILSDESSSVFMNIMCSTYTCTC